MSDASKTSELLREAREWRKAQLPESPWGEGHIVNRLADALESTTRVPVQGEPNDAREALRDEFRSYLGDEIYVCSRDHSAWPHGTMGLDDFSLAAQDDEIIESLVGIALARATVPDAATEELETLRDIAETHAFCADRLSIETERADRVAREVCDRGCSYTGGSDEECSAHGRTPRELWEFIAQDIVGRDAATARAEKAETERDAALAAVERVRAAVDGPHPANSGLDSFTLAHVSAALDGAPEPEVKP